MGRSAGGDPRIVQLASDRFCRSHGGDVPAAGLRVPILSATVDRLGDRSLWNGRSDLWTRTHGLATDPI